jgi:hypothetical protein
MPESTAAALAGLNESSSQAPISDTELRDRAAAFIVSLEKGFGG